MARRPILPLPEDQMGRIQLAADEIETRLGPSGTGRAFVREFLPIAYAVTGEVLGASTVRQLLRQLTGRRPSTAAIQEEVAEFKESLLTMDVQLRQARQDIASLELKLLAVQKERDALAVRLESLLSERDDSGPEHQ